LIIAIFTYFDQNYLVLEAIDNDDNNVLCSKIIKKGDSFRLSFQNSISKTMAIEKFNVLNVDFIELSEFRYQSCDAGFPLGINYDFSIEEDYMVIKGINRIFSEIINVRIATNYPHYLFIGDFKCNLTKKAAGHTLLIRVKKIFSGYL